MKKIVVLQDGNKECGVACLLSVIRYYSGNVSINKLLELTNTTKDGTNFLDMQIAMKEIGLNSKGYKVIDLNELENLKKPFISQVVINNYNHFVVVYKMKNKITIMDPAKGMRVISYDEFKSIFTGYILLVEPYKKLLQMDDKNYLLQIIKEIIINNKKIIINLLIQTFLLTIFTCIYSYHFKMIIDFVINTQLTNLLIVTVVFIIIFFLKQALDYLRNNLLLYLNQKIDISVIVSTINKILLLPYSYYKNKTTGELISRINDLFYVKNIISKLLLTLFLDLILAICVFLILFKISVKMTILLLIITIIYLLLFLISKKIIQSMTNTIQEGNADVNSLLVESISSYETIKGLNIENVFKSKVTKKYLKVINNNIDFSKMKNMLDFLLSLFEGIIIILIIFIGANGVINNELSLGSLITYNTLIFYFLIPIKNSFDFFYELFYVKNSIKRVNNILSYGYDKLDKTSDLVVGNDIIIDKLKFSYNQKNYIIKEFSLTIHKNNKVLILGDSGSGKSTFLKILYRYYEIPRNMVYINSFDINDYTLLDIRKNITYISQNELLYTDTIKNNIILERKVSDEEFYNICKITRCDEIIKNNMLGYDYVLEENGANISGGQKQRIILARALIKNSKIILIDEGFSEIDVNLERLILLDLFKYFKDIMFLIVSHRKNNLDLYDNVINFNLVNSGGNNG